MSLLLRMGAMVALLVVCAIASPFQEQTPSPEQAEPGYEFVSGTIVELPPGKIVVNRAVLGKPAEIRTFTITGETKVEGRLRTRARVTVGFKSSDEPEPVAHRIIVRPQASSQKRQ